LAHPASPVKWTFTVWSPTDHILIYAVAARTRKEYRAGSVPFAFVVRTVGRSCSSGVRRGFCYSSEG
jgi:hypothetical protein